MNDEIRCLNCGRLLGKMVLLKGDATISLAIKCKCRVINVKKIKIVKNIMQNEENAL